MRRRLASYEREAAIYDPLHYLALLEHKSRALDQAAPLAGLQLPECFAQLRRLLDARLNKHAAREYRAPTTGLRRRGGSTSRCCGCWRPSLWKK
jgi:hypothetical protein